MHNRQRKLGVVGQTQASRGSKRKTITYMEAKESAKRPSYVSSAVSPVAKISTPE
uniref:Uncharacterized protein n=1 Tax=Arion vulgaris TaxID=1028688 RepID=A0A0B7AWH0_9EUPU